MPANYDLTQPVSHSRWWEVVWIGVIVGVVLLLTSFVPRVRWDREQPRETQFGLLK